MSLCTVHGAGTGPCHVWGELARGAGAAGTRATDTVATWCAWDRGGQHRPRWARIPGLTGPRAVGRCQARHQAIPASVARATAARRRQCLGRPVQTCRTRCAGPSAGTTEGAQVTHDDGGAGRPRGTRVPWDARPAALSRDQGPRASVPPCGAIPTAPSARHATGSAVQTTSAISAGTCPGHTVGACWAQGSRVVGAACGTCVPRCAIA